MPITIAGEDAICLAEYRPNSQNIYLVNGDKSNTTVVNAKTEIIKKGIQQYDSGPGGLGARLGEDFLCVLNTAPEINLINTKYRKTVQRLNLTSLESRQDLGF